MNGRGHVAVIAGVASLLAITPLTVVYESWGWLLGLSVVLITLISGTAIIARSLRFPAPLQPLATLAVLTAFLTFRYGAGLGLFSVIPTPGVLRHFALLLDTAGTDIQEVAAPAPTREALEFLTLCGVGIVAAVIDLLVVTLRRPALAGLPMLAVYSVPVAVYSASMPALPFILSATGYMWLLVATNTDHLRRWGSRVSGDGKGVSVGESSPLAVTGRRLGVISLMVAVAIPLAIPGLSSGFLDKFGVVGVTGADGGPGGAGGSGNSANVNPITMLRGNLVRDKAIEMARVTTDDRTPGFLRLAVADEVTSDGFRPSPPRGPRQLTDLPDPAEGMLYNVTRKEHEATIEILNLDTQYLPLYAIPTTVAGKKLKGNWLYDTSTDIAYSTRGGTARTATYSETYSDITYTAQELDLAPDVSPTDPAYRRFTSVPDNAYVLGEIARLTENTNTQYEKVKALLEYFSTDNGFQYSLATADGTSGSLIEDFLKNKKGYCEQYSSAMAWMVRSAGIPARVATGFTRGTQDPRDPKTFILTNFNLHAWVEVYFTGYGWVPFDPTPSANVPGSVALPWAPDPSRVDTSIAETPELTPADPTDPNISRLDNDRDAGSSTGPLPDNATQHQLGWHWYTLGALALLGVALLPAGIRVVVRRRRKAIITAARDTADVRQRAQAAWAEFTDLLADHGFDTSDAETPRALIRRLTIRQLGGQTIDGPLAGAAAAGAHLLAGAEEQGRYAATPQDIPGLPEALTAVRAGLRADETRAARWRAEFLPASTLTHCRAGITRLSHRLRHQLGRAPRLIRLPGLSRRS